MIAELQTGEQILKYKSVYALKRESDEIDVWFRGEFEKYKRIDALCEALVNGDSDALAKAASPELEVAKAEVAHLRKKYGERAAASLYLTSMERLAAIMRERTRRTEANNEEERRSSRFNRAWSSASPGAQWPTIH